MCRRQLKKSASIPSSAGAVISLLRLGNGARPSSSFSWSMFGARVALHDDGRQ
jgi:hypothetical protein